MTTVAGQQTRLTDVTVTDHHALDRPKCFRCRQHFHDHVTKSTNYSEECNSMVMLRAVMHTCSCTVLRHCLTTLHAWTRQLCYTMVISLQQRRCGLYRPRRTTEHVSVILERAYRPDQQINSRLQLSSVIIIKRNILSSTLCPEKSNPLNNVR